MSTARDSGLKVRFSPRIISMPEGYMQGKSDFYNLFENGIGEIILKMPESLERFGVDVDNLSDEEFDELEKISDTLRFFREVSWVDKYSIKISRPHSVKCYRDILRPAVDKVLRQLKVINDASLYHEIVSQIRRVFEILDPGVDRDDPYKLSAEDKKISESIMVFITAVMDQPRFEFCLSARATR